MDINNQSTVSTSALLDLYDVLKNKNIVSSDIHSVLGFSRNDLTNVEKRVPASLQKKLWDLARENAQYPNIGLIVGTNINENATGMLSQILIHSSDLREALHLFIKNIDLMSQCERVSIINKSWGCRIIFESTHADFFGIYEVERSLSSAITWSCYLANTKITPIKVGFPHSKVDYSDEYQAVFGNNTCFNQQHAFIDIDNSSLDLPIITANAFIKNAIVKYVNSFIGDLKKIEKTSCKVKLIIESDLKNGDFSSDDIAQKLNMSRQTLHRKLKKEGVNFRQLSEDVRKNKAIEYLSSDKYHLEEISFMLGFKEVSGFYRAFKSWFNMTPKVYQKQLQKKP